MDITKCSVIVLTTEGNITPQNLSHQDLHALVKARESYIRYQASIRIAVVQTLVSVYFLFFRSYSAETISLGVLGGSLIMAAFAGFGALAWKRRFERSSP